MINKDFWYSFALNQNSDIQKNTDDMISQDIILKNLGRIWRLIALSDSANPIYFFDLETEIEI